MTVWRELDESDAVAGALLDLYDDRGGNQYDEVVTQTAHAVQCASHAMAAGADDALVVAALLHDVGHLLSDAHDADLPSADRHHERVGSRFLANWFDPAVTRPVELHVPAKRYLCAVDPTYAADLSPASIRSLAVQGGPMSPDEAVAFEALVGFEDAVLLRRFDDLAKQPDAPVPDLHVFRPIIAGLVRRQPPGSPPPPPGGADKFTPA